MPHTSNIQNLLKNGESQTVEFKTSFGREVTETGNSSDIQIKIFDDKITFSEVYLEKAFDDTGWRPKKRLPVAHELGETSLMFLVHPTLTDAEIKLTCKVIREVMLLCTVG